MARKGSLKGLVVAQNRKARNDYLIGEVFEAGIMLTGSEVKSLRAGQASIVEGYAAEDGGELWLVNSHIPEYGPARQGGHEPKRRRKLLLKRREIAKLIGAVKRDGMTLVPLSVYFNERGRAKLELALARGKRKVDKRASIKDRDWKRDKARLMRARG